MVGAFEEVVEGLKEPQSAAAQVALQATPPELGSLLTFAFRLAVSLIERLPGSGELKATEIGPVEPPLSLPPHAASAATVTMTVSKAPILFVVFMFTPFG
jgi:hypothetical protein